MFLKSLFRSRRAAPSRGVHSGRRMQNRPTALSVENLEARQLLAITVIPTTGLLTSEAGATAGFSVVLDTAPTATVTIPITSSDLTEGTVSTPSLVFTPANWNIAQTVTVTGVNDDLADGNIDYSINVGPAVSDDVFYHGFDPANVSLTNIDDDFASISVSPISGVTTEAGGAATFTVVLTSEPTADVTIPLSSSDTTEGTVAPASLVFTSLNWNTPQTVTVTGVNDNVDDGDISYSIVTGPAISADPSYNGLNPADVAVTNVDDDTRGILVAPLSGLTTTESGGTATFTVVLTSQPTANVTIPLSSSNTSEGTVSPASLVFTPANWATPQTVTVTGVNDDVDDGDILYSIVTGAATGASDYVGINAPDVSVTNLNNDAAGITVTPTSVLMTSESGGTATFAVVLDSQPTGNVTIPLTSSDLTEGTVDVNFLTFTPGNWFTPQLVTVAGVDDGVADGNVAYSIITGAALSNDLKYQGKDADDVTLLNADSNSATAAVTVFPTSGLVTTEAGGTASFAVVLNKAPTSVVAIGFASSNPGEGVVFPHFVQFTTTNWNMPQIVTVTGVNDNVDDGDVVYQIVTSAGSMDASYNGLPVADVTLTNLDNDTAGITVAPTSPLETTEAGGTATFTVVLNTQPTANVTIPLSSSDMSEGTVAPASLLFTPADWFMPQTVTVTGVDDDLGDGNVAYTVVTGVAISADPKYSGLDADDVTLVNIDDEPAGIAVTATANSATNRLLTSESGSTATFTIVLTRVPSGDVTIPLTSSDTTEGTVDKASVTFTPANWNVPQTVTVTGVDDMLADGNINYSIVTGAATSTDPAYNGLNATDVFMTNVDDEGAVPGITVSGASNRVTTEAGGSFSFGIVLNSQPTANVTIPLSSSDTTEGVVFPASVTFTPFNYNQVQTVTVTGVDDAVADGNVVYTIITAPATSSDSAYTNLNAIDLSVTNIDDDAIGVTVTPTTGLTTTEAGGTATFTMVLTSQPTADVTIPLSSSDPTEGTVTPLSVTFTPANWNVPQTITVTGVNDLVADGNVAYSIVTGAITSADSAYAALVVANVDVINLDDDTSGVAIVPATGLMTTEAGGTATFTVVLTSQPAADVIVNLASSDLSEGTVSAPSLTFTPADWNIPRIVTVTGVDDNVDDGDVAYQIVITVTSADLDYNGLAIDDVQLTNLDDDTRGIIVSPASGVTTESGGTATFTVVLNSQPTADVTIPLSSSNTAEGTVAPASVTFTPANWNVPQTFTVTGVDDLVVDGPVAYTIVTGAAISTDGVYSGLDAADVAMINEDNDPAILVAPSSGLVTTESGGTATFTVVLNTQPTADVTIPLSSSNTAEGTVAPASVTFTPGNWNVPQTVTVTGVDDFLVDGDVAYSIVTGAAISADLAYSGLDAADVALINEDNDAVGIAVTPTAGLITTESGGTATFTMVLNSQPTANVTIPLSSSNTAEGTVSSASVTFTPANWNVPQTVTVTGVDDFLVDGDVAYSIVTGAAISADLAYSGLDAADVAAINLDNDAVGIEVTPTSGLFTTESGGTATFTMVLNSQPTANVTIPLSSSNTAEGTVSPASVTFTPANWNVPQTVTVTGVNDLLADGDAAYSIVTGAAISTDLAYSGLDAADVGLTNLADDSLVTGAVRTGGTITIVGTNSNDRIVVSMVPGNRFRVVAGFLPGGRQLFNAAGVNLFKILAMGGDDVVMVRPNVSVRTLIDGGDGNDMLTGGSGSNILLGGNGDDVLTGRGARDILIGGLGSDFLLGGAGQNILVDGTTVYDSLPGGQPNTEALLRISDEWNSARTRAQRVRNIRGTGTGPRLNANDFFRLGVEVQNDDSIDTLQKPTSSSPLNANWVFKALADNLV